MTGHGCDGSDGRLSELSDVLSYPIDGSEYWIRYR